MLMEELNEIQKYLSNLKEDKKKKEEKKIQREQTDKMMKEQTNTNTSTTYINLNIYDLKAPIKRQRLSDCI